MPSQGAIPFAPSAGVVNALYVNKLTGDDNRTKAEARSPLTPFETIGRALWGDADRNNPTPLQAADAGDTVVVIGGPTPGSAIVYGSAVQLNDRLGVLYNPTNSGTPGNFITITPDGYVRLAGHALNAGVIGSVGKDWIKWYADRATAKFLITCDGRFASAVNIASSTVPSANVLQVVTDGDHNFTNGEEVHIYNHDCTPPFDNSQGWQAIVTVINSTTFEIPTPGVTVGGGATGTVQRTEDTKADTTIVNPTADTGPVIFNGSENCWLEGFDIDGGPQVDWNDNWSGVRTESAFNTTIRNCKIWNFYVRSGAGNSSAVKHYSSEGTLVEQCELHHCGTGISTKDIPGGAEFGNENYTYRRLYIHDVGFTGDGGSFFSWSQTDQLGGDITENLCVGAVGHALHMTGGNMNFERIFNNTFVGFGPSGTGDGVFVSTPLAWSTVKILNNIWSSSPSRMLEYSGQNCPAATACSYQHQVYHQTAGQFYSGNEGNLDFASFNSAHTDQHSVDPDSVTDDPEFVDPGNGDYTLGVSSPARDLGRHPDTDAVVDAGCYPLGYRVLGLEVA